MSTEITGANVIAANVGMNITSFMESAEKMATYLDVLNLQLKQLSNIKVGSMSIGNITKDLDNMNRLAIAQAESQNKITLSREKGALEQERILTQTIMAEQESATKIGSILAQRVGNEELNAARILAVREESIAAIARTDAARIATEEATNARSATAAAQRIALEETTGVRLAQISANTQLTQARIATEGLRQQNMIQNASHASSQTYLGKMTRSLGSHLGTMGSMVALYGGIHLLKEGIVDFGADLAGVEQVLEETYHKMGTELSPEMMAKIGESFSTIAERWGQSVKDVLQGAKDWGRQYKDLNTIQELVNASTLLSVVDNMSLNESVKGLEATMNQYGMVARNAGEAQAYSMRIVDSWSAVAHKSMISAQDLAQGNQKAASSARMMGIDFDNLQGMIAAGVRATGRSGNELGNTLKTMFASLHSDDAVEQLHKLGVEVKSIEGNFRPAQEVFADLMIAMAGTKYNMEEVVKSVSSGKFQWSKAAAILGDYDTYVKATAQSINSAGLAQKYMAVQMDTVSRKAGQLHQALIALTVSAGNSGLTGAIKGTLDNLRYFVDGLNNGGMKAVTLGIAIVGLANIYKAIQPAITGATAAQKALNLATAVGKALTGNWVSLLAAGAVLGVGAYTIGLGKAADAQTELVEQQKQAVEQHKQMSEQYGREIDFMSQLEEQHNKLSAASKNSSNTDEQKANINKSLEATEESLAITIGESSATKIRDAGYTHEAFQSVAKSLQYKQDAEKIAWQNSSKMVSEATNNLRQNITAQIKQIGEVTEAYGILGKVEEAYLGAKSWIDNKRLAIAKQTLDINTKNGIVDEVNVNTVKELEETVANNEAWKIKFYKKQQSDEIAKHIAKLNNLGGTESNTVIPDIPYGSGFNETPFGGDDDKTKAKTKTEILEIVTGPYADLIRESAKQNSISATLIDSVIKQESNFNANAHNDSGASGLMQLMPGTASDLSVSNVYDPAQNIQGGSKYLAQMMSAFNNDKELALAAYNWGIGNVKTALKKTSGTTFADISGYAPSETKNYVSTIMGDFNSRKNNQTAVDEIGNKKSTEAEIPTYTDLTDAILAESVAQATLTKTKSDAIKAEIELSKASKDYQKTLALTDSLIGSSNASKKLSTLLSERDKINSLKDAAIKSSKFTDTSSWFDSKNNPTSTYTSSFASQSEEAKVIMQKEFAEMQKLRNDWLANKKSTDNIFISPQELEDAKKALLEINKAKDDALANSKFGDISRWFDSANNASQQYLTEFANQNGEVQSAMNAEFSTMQSLRDQWVSNTSLSDHLSINAKEMSDLGTAKDKINALKDALIASSSDKFGDISRWFNASNEASTTFVNEKNNSTAVQQKSMDELFSTMQKLRKAWQENSESIKTNIQAQKDYAKQVKEDTISSIQAQSESLSSAETQKLDSSFTNLNIDEWIKNNVSATKTWESSLSDLQAEMSKLGNPTTLAGQEKYNELLAQSAKATWDAKKSADAYQKSIDKTRMDSILENADASLKAITDQIENVDHAMALAKDGISSEIPDIEYNVTPILDIDTPSEAVKKFKQETEDEEFSFKPPYTFVEYINNEFTNAVNSTKENIAQLQIKISSLGEITPENKNQILSYYQDIQAEVDKLADTSNKAQLGLKISLADGDISQEDFDLKMQQLDVASISVLAVPTIQIADETTAGIEALKTQLSSIPVDVDTKSADEKIAKLISENYEKVITAVIEDTVATQEILKLQEDTFSIHTIRVKTESYSSPTSTPTATPAYASGTDSALKGKAIVDEEGAELRINPSTGEMILGTDSGAKLVDLNQGDIVVPNKETKEYLHRMGVPGYAKGKNYSDLSSSDLIDTKIDLYESLIETATDKIDDLYKSIAKYKNKDGSYDSNDTTKSAIGEINSLVSAEKAAQLAIKALIKEKYEAEWEGFDKLQSQYDDQLKYNDQLIAYNKLIGKSTAEILSLENSELVTNQSKTDELKTQSDSLTKQLSQLDESSYEYELVYDKLTAVNSAYLQSLTDIEEKKREILALSWADYDLARDRENWKLSANDSMIDYDEQTGVDKGTIIKEKKVEARVKGNELSTQIAEQKSLEVQYENGLISGDLVVGSGIYNDLIERYRSVTDAVIATKSSIASLAQEIADLDMENALSASVDKLDDLDFASSLLNEDDLQGKLDSYQSRLEAFTDKVAIIQDKIKNVAINNPTATKEQQDTFVKQWLEDLEEVKISAHETAKEIGELKADNLIKPFTDSVSGVKNNISLLGNLDTIHDKEKAYNYTKEVGVVLLEESQKLTVKISSIKLQLSALDPDKAPEKVAELKAELDKLTTAQFQVKVDIISNIDSVISQLNSLDVSKIEEAFDSVNKIWKSSVTPTTLEGQKKYNELLTEQATKAHDAAKAQEEYAKTVAKAKLDQLLSNTEGQMKEINDAINLLDHYVSLDKDGKSSAVPKVNYVDTPYITPNTADQAAALVEKPGSDTFTYTPPKTFVDFINTEFSTALDTANKKIDGLQGSIKDLGPITDANINQFLQYTGEINSVGTGLNKTYSDAKKSLQDQLAAGTLSLTDFNTKLAQLESANISVLVKPELTISNDVQGQINTVGKALADNITAGFQSKIDATELSIIALNPDNPKDKVQIDKYLADIKQYWLDAQAKVKATITQLQADLIDPTKTADQKTVITAELGELKVNYSTIATGLADVQTKIDTSNGKSPTTISVSADTTDATAKIKAVEDGVYKATVVLSADVSAIQSAIDALKSDTSTPKTTLDIPHNAMGTKSHPGGPMIWGEKGMEAGILPGGKMILSGDDGAELTSMPEGTEILTHPETEKLLKSQGVPGYEEGTGKSLADLFKIAGLKDVSQLDKLDTSSLLEMKTKLYEYMISTAGTSIKSLTTKLNTSANKNTDGTYKDNETTQAIVSEIKSIQAAEENAQTAIKGLVVEKYNAEWAGFDKQQANAEWLINNSKNELEYSKLIGKSKEDILKQEDDMLTLQEIKRVEAVKEQADLKKQLEEGLTSGKFDTKSIEYNTLIGKYEVVTDTVKTLNTAVYNTAAEIANLKFENLISPFKDMISDLEVLSKLLDEKDLAGNLSNIQSQMRNMSSEVTIIQQQIADTSADPKLSAEEKSKRIGEYVTKLEEAEVALKGLANAEKDWLNKQLADSNKTQLTAIEKTLFNGSTQQEAQDILQHKIDLQKEYVLGEEKDLEITKLRHQIQSSSLTLTSEQLAILNSTDKIERTSLERLQKQLDIQGAQVRLNNLQGQKNIGTMAKDATGNWDISYVADQDAIDKAQEDLATKKVDLIKWEQDQVNNADKEAIDEKGKYLARVKSITDKAQSGEYATYADFTRDMDRLNQEYLGGMASDTSVEWTNIYNSTQTNLSSVKSSYSTYVSDLALLAAQAKQAYRDIVDAQALAKTASDNLTPTVVVPAVVDPIAPETPSIKPTTYYDKKLGGIVGATPEMTEFVLDFVVNTGKNPTIQEILNEYPELKSFGEGGVIDYTGLARVHGSSATAEVAFNSSQASKLYNWVKDMPNGPLIPNAYDLTANPVDIKGIMQAAFSELNIGGIMSSVSDSIKGALLGMKSSNGTQQVFHIDKLEFPNVRSADGLKDALSSLPTRAIQVAFGRS